MGERYTGPPRRVRMRPEETGLPAVFSIDKVIVGQWSVSFTYVPDFPMKVINCRCYFKGEENG